MRLPAILGAWVLVIPLTAAGQQAAPSRSQPYGAGVRATVPAAPQLSPEAAALLAQRDELSAAIVKGDTRRVAAWIRAHRDVNFNFDDIYRGRTFQSPLTLAISRDFVPVARLLLEAGAGVDRKDGNGSAAIHYAKSDEAVKLLAQHGADLNALDRSGRTAAFSAAERGNTPAVDKLVERGARLDVGGEKADLYARVVETGRPEMIGALLDRGVDPRKPPTRALWLLIDRGDSERALLLIRRGADPDAANARGDTLLAHALFRKRWDIAEALIDAGANVRLADAPGCRERGFGCQSRQFARLASLNPALLARLKAKGLDLDAVSSDGHSALSSLIVEQPLAVRAVAHAGSLGVARPGVAGPAVARAPAATVVKEIPAPDNVARVRALLEAGSNANTRYRGALPLMLAVQMARAEMADLLLAAGGRIEYQASIVRGNPVPRLAGGASPELFSERTIPTNEISIIGMSVGPLTWALHHGRPDIALRLLERDQRVTPADRDLLFFAAAAGQWDLVLGALPHAREVDASNRADVTPLMMAADDGRADAVQALLAAGASVNARSVRNWPPLSDFNLGSAIAGHSPAPPRLAGGYTALRAAREKGHSDVVRILTEAGGRD